MTMIVDWTLLQNHREPAENFGPKKTIIRIIRLVW